MPPKVRRSAAAPRAHTPPSSSATRRRCVLVAIFDAPTLPTHTLLRRYLTLRRCSAGRPRRRSRVSSSRRTWSLCPSTYPAPIIGRVSANCSKPHAALCIPTIPPPHTHTHTPAVAVINIRHKKFEYYDPMRGGEGMVLDNLRQWLQASGVSGRVSESVAAPSLGRDVNVSKTPPVPVAGRVARQDAEADLFERLEDGCVQVKDTLNLTD